MIVFRALRNATDAQRAELMGILGNSQATADQIEQATQLLHDLDGVRYTQALAQQYVDEALTGLSALPNSPSKALLEQWSAYLIDRQR